VNQLRKSAQVEIAAREKKRDQEKTIESIRLLVESGKLDDATQTLDAALAKQLSIHLIRGRSERPKRLQRPETQLRKSLPHPRRLNRRTSRRNMRFFRNRRKWILHLDQKTRL